ncbi:MAG: hypothetical protein QM642_02860 [Edaphocola sp.]
MENLPHLYLISGLGADHRVFKNLDLPGYVSIENKEWISIDGKAIGGTVTGSHSIDQSFISVVSLYCSKKKLVIGNAVLVNSKALHLRQCGIERSIAKNRCG